MKQEQKPRSPWLTVILIIFGLTLISLVLAGVVGLFIDAPAVGNVAVIKIVGPISVERATGWGVTATSSREVLKLLQDAEDDPGIDAILLDINSPGGSAVASDEIGQAVKNSSKPTVALIRELGASGGYWVASASDHVVANRLSLTGSIGVIGSYLEFAGLMDRYNVTYRRLVAGKYKDMGSPFKELTPEEEQLFQSVLDDMRSEFIDEVARNRNLPRAQVERLATGQIYLGKQALELGLVDELGSEEEAKTYLHSRLNITVDLVPFDPEPSLLDILGGVFHAQSFTLGKGIGTGLAQQAEQAGLPQLR
ncbi:MAG TPA: signal peptide peptidase SppA [Candidatus Nanoarchaeia archaeon]|nr:signal peptide peptidase SppA [Candidatus Nanoarchaeia archaeon]